MLRQPAIYVPHGGGPWPFVDLKGMIPQRDLDAMRAYLVELPKRLPESPKALLVVSAHWEEEVPTVMTSAHPPMLYDYGGFPPESYEIQWPAPGAPELAKRVAQLLTAAGIPSATDASRGFDHGTFVPFKVSWPNAEVPCLQLSLRSSLDPDEHLKVGQALAGLRDEGVLILGSGMSFHDLRGLFRGTGRQVSEVFDAWLTETATAEPQVRDGRLRAWKSAPLARHAHPREEHLLPLMVVAGAAGADVGRVTFSDQWMHARISAYHFGA